MSTWDMVMSENNNGGNTVEFVKTPVGTTRIRVIDSEPKAIWKHWVKSANGGKGMSVVCKGKDECPICKANNEAKEKGLKPPYSTTLAFAMNSIVKGTDENGQTVDKIAILEKSKTFFKTLGQIMSASGDLINYEINIMRTGEKMNDTKYTILPVFPYTPLENKEEWIEKKINLDEYYKPLSDEDLTTLMNGGQLGKKEELGDVDFSIDSDNPFN